MPVVAIVVLAVIVIIVTRLTLPERRAFEWLALALLVAVVALVWFGQLYVTAEYELLRRAQEFP